MKSTENQMEVQMNWQLPLGFRFNGIHCGIREEKERKDLAVFLSDSPATAAGVFTSNRVKAAPVRVCQERLPARDIRAVVVCSGNANACTGDRGLADARRMTALAAEKIGCADQQVLVCSTGIIGRHLPMDALEQGIPQVLATASGAELGLSAAAHAILTTDTRIKIACRKMQVKGKEVRLLGVAKGAAMIGPNMATLLAFVFTDATGDPVQLQSLLARTAEKTFNCVSVEGHTSTNDSLILLANGQSGCGEMGESWEEFAGLVEEICAALAKEIAADAEGATHLITVEVAGLRDDAEAKKVARTVSDSALVKTAVFGADPNWGRIVSAAGYAGVAFEEENLTLFLGDYCLYKNGAPQPVDPAAASAYLKNNRQIHMRLEFNLGQGRCIFQTCDLTYDYVRLNAEYTT